MTLLILGLVLLIGGHCITLMRGLRARLIARFGEGTYKGVYSLVALAGLVLTVWGFGAYRAGGYIEVWSPPRGMSHLTLTLMLPAMILLAVFLLPAGRMKSAVQHPMLAMIKVWALAHLLANGDLGSILLFGSFLVYAVAARIAVKRRGTPPLPARGWTHNDALALLIGAGLYLAVLFVLHPVLFGVPALPGR